jgi:hypothetical protein
LETPLAVYFCPARRAPIAWAAPAGTWMATPTLCATLTVLGRVDYAVNGGENMVWFGSGPGSLAAAGTYAFPTAKANTGIMMVHNRFKFTDIDDGLSNTFMLGEKYVIPDCYTTGLTLGDDQGPFVADERDSYRAAAFDIVTPPNTSGNLNPPVQDTPGFDDAYGFGSAHSGGLFFVLCDSSVRFINYSVDEMVYRHLANRKDGVPIDPNQF